MPGFESNILEMLEGRRLLSSSVVLYIEGSDDRDSITVSSNSTTITVIENGVTSTYDITPIRRVIMDCNAGNDNVNCANLKLPLKFYGGNGNDTLVGSEKNDTITGGDGRDSLVGGKGHDYIDGDGENDTLRGGKGNDTIVGDDGADQLFGDEDNDDLNADDDFFTDTVTGGSGTDHAFVDNTVSADDVLGDTIEDVDD